MRSSPPRAPLGISPPGSNDFACKPSAAHPYPVVLVHGTLLDQTEDWVLMSLVLKRAGYCVFSLDYGNRATGPIETSARELAAFAATRRRLRSPTR